jgi:hypothetical protein
VDDELVGVGESLRSEDCIPKPRLTDFEGVVEHSDNGVDVRGRRVGVF